MKDIKHSDKVPNSIASISRWKTAGNESVYKKMSYKNMDICICIYVACSM